MTDKEKLDAVRAEIHRLVDVRGYDREMANDLFAFMNSLPNEPVSEELEKAADEWDESLYRSDAFKAGAKWQKAKDESTIEDLGKYINELSKQFPEVSFAKLSRIAVRVSRWQRNQDVKNKLPKVINRTDLDEYAYQCAYDMSNDWAIENPTWHDVEDACKLGAEWQKEQFEKNRLAACDRQTAEDADRESDFIMGIIEKEHRQPTFDDAIKYGMKLKEEQMMVKAIDAQLLEGHLIRQKGVTHPLHIGDKVKVIVIKED